MMRNHLLDPESPQQNSNQGSYRPYGTPEQEDPWFEARPGQQHAPMNNYTQYGANSNGFTSNGFSNPQYNNVGQPASSYSMNFDGRSPGGVGGGVEDDYDNELPLLEELGIRFDHIWSKTQAVINPTKKLSNNIMDDADLAGPLFFCLLLGSCLLLAGKVHFGYIYGFSVFGCIGMYLILNLLHTSGLDFVRTCSVLGYCLLPVIGLASLSILVNLKGLLGMIFSTLAIGWSTFAAVRAEGAIDESGLPKIIQRFIIWTYARGFHIGHLSLTVRQMDVIIQAGQQPGVPFRLGAAGAQRPQGNRVKVNYAENLISMRKNSLKLAEWDANGDITEFVTVDMDDFSGKGGQQRRDSLPSYSLSFVYDSLVPAVVRIFIGATDRTTTQQLRAEGASLVLGPYHLEEGKNRLWSSNLEDCCIDGKYFIPRSNVAGGQKRRSQSAVESNPGAGQGTGSTGNGAPARPGDMFELMVCLAPEGMAPKCGLFSPVSNQVESASHSQMQRRKKLNPDQQSEAGTSTTSVNSPSSSEWGNKLAGGSSKDSTANTCTIDLDSSQSIEGKRRKKPTTPETAVNSLKSTSVSVGSDETMPTGKTQSRHVAIHTADPDLSKSSNVICEVSYIRVSVPKSKEVITPVESVQNMAAVDCQYNVINRTPSESANAVESGCPSSSTAPKLLDIKCIMQRVQMASGVFLTQDIYGMDRNRIEEDPTPVTDEEDLTSDSPLEAEREGTSTAPVTSIPPGITLDSDAIECVICLTDNRTIAVYPCRHMCLCASCAEVLPSQGNKCPICRRGASMLLQISPKGGCEDSV